MDKIYKLIFYNHSFKLFQFLSSYSLSRNWHLQFSPTLAIRRCDDQPWTSRVNARNPTLRWPTLDPAYNKHVTISDGASRRSVSANTANLHLAGVATELKSCWKDGSFYTVRFLPVLARVAGSAVCCTLVPSDNKLELIPRPPSIRAAHDCDLTRM